MAKNTNIIELSSAKYVRIAEHNGEEVRLYARPINKEDFTECQVYSLVASRGSVKGAKEYFVTVDDYNKFKPKTTRASVSRDAIVETLMEDMGISREQAEALHAKMQANVLAKKAKK